MEKGGAQHNYYRYFYRVVLVLLRFYSVWDKARLSLELAESKLRTLHSQLKLQDKEELTLKRLKAEGGDKVLDIIYLYYFRVRRSSVGSASACFKAGPSSILCSAPQGNFSH